MRIMKCSGARSQLYQFEVQEGWCSSCWLGFNTWHIDMGQLEHWGPTLSFCSVLWYTSKVRGWSTGWGLKPLSYIRLRQRRSCEYWWTTRVNSVPLPPRRPAIPWIVLMRVWAVGRGKWLDSSSWHSALVVVSQMPSSGILNTRKIWTHWCGCAKTVRGLDHVTYERLRELDLLSLRKRRQTGDTLLLSTGSSSEAREKLELNSARRCAVIVQKVVDARWNMGNSA